MAWTTISKPTLGEATKKSLADAIIDDLADLNSRVALVGSGALQNGSFEYDADVDGIPDGWTRTLYTGGSSAIETTDVAHGEKAYKFTSPGGSGNGGGYVLSDTYLTCSMKKYLFIDFLIKSSVADIHNLVEILWYDKAKSYLSLSAVYDEATTNPTSYVRYILGVLPPASAVYCRVRLTGAKNDDATAGTCYFDGVSLFDTGSDAITFAELAEQSLAVGNDWTDAGSVVIHLPTFGNAASKANISFIAQLRKDGSSALAYQRFRIGSDYSPEENSVAGPSSYADYRYTVIYVGTGGTATLYQQLKANSGTGFAKGKIDAASVSVEIIQG